MNQRPEQTLTRAAAILLGAFILLFGDILNVNQPLAVRPVAAQHDCDGVAEYIAAMQDATGPYLEAWASIPGIEIMSPEEFRSIAAQTDDLASAYERIDPPSIAGDYHTAYIKELRGFANFLRDAATLGPVAAALAHYGDRTEGEPSEMEIQERLLAQRCAEFQPYLVWLNTYPDSPASPVATPT